MGRATPGADGDDIVAQRQPRRILLAFCLLELGIAAYGLVSADLLLASARAALAKHEKAA